MAKKKTVTVESAAQELVDALDGTYGDDNLRGPVVDAKNKLRDVLGNGGGKSDDDDGADS
jgi:hypothetical protein